LIVLKREKLAVELLEHIEEEYGNLLEDSANIDNLREKDFVTKIDEKVRDLIEEFFRSRKEKFKLVTEEKRSFEENPEDPDFTVIIDEMDATHHLIEQEGPFGTVFAVAEGENPEFQDVAVSGFIDLGNDKKYVAVRNEGAYLLADNKKKNLKTSRQTDFGEGLETTVLLQQGFLAERPEIAQEAWKRWCNDYGSQGKHYAMIASGRRDVYITGGFSKIAAKPANTAEEAAGMYLMVEETGGSVLSWEKEKIGGMKIGMARGKNHNLVAASTRKLAEEVIDVAIKSQY